MPAPSAQKDSPLHAIARAVLWPMRRFFDPRFGGIAAHVSAEAHATRTHVGALTADQHHVQLREQERLLADLRRFVSADRDASVEAATLVGEALRDLQELSEQTLEAIRETEQEAARASGAYFERLSTGDVADLDADVARLLNYATGHTGFAGQRGLWFNWPLALSYGPEDVRLDSVNERIVEIPYALRATAQLAPGSRILDVGATESTLSLFLASLGFEVVALDPRPYPVSHPNLRVEAHPIETWEGDGLFQAILCISTIEHLGSGEYGNAPRSDDAAGSAMTRLRELTEPGGTLVLTTPLGESEPESDANIFDRRRVEQLLADWEIVDFTTVDRLDLATWVPGGTNGAAHSVALVTARRPS